MEKTFLGMELAQKFDKCAFNFKLSTKSTDRTDDSLISLSPTSFAKIVAINGDTLKIKKILTSPYSQPLRRNLPWSLVGVFRFEGISNDITEIKRSDIYGKSIIVDNVIMNVNVNILREK